MADGAPTAIGMVLGEAYRLTREIGRGGMGAVYEGVHLRLSRRVAVKLMARELAMNTEALARFRREAEVTSQLGHPHIVQVFDFGEAPTGEPYLVMELLEGEDLDARLRRTGRQPVAVAVHIVKQIASALAATHAKGIVHRDLKPANVFMLAVEGETDFVKVVDFGISKVKAATTRLTAAAAVMGTPNYMSPEQAAGRIDEIDSATDQWALACIAYELLAGRPPFVGDSIASLLYQVVHEAPSPLAASTLGLPSGLQDVLSCALSKKPAERFASVAAFARAFEERGHGRRRRGVASVVGRHGADGARDGADGPFRSARRDRGIAAQARGDDDVLRGGGRGRCRFRRLRAARPGRRGQRRLLAGVGALAVAGLAVGAVALTRPRGAVAPAAVSASAAPPSAPPAPAAAPVAAPTPPPVAPAVAPAPAAPVAAPTPAPSAATARATPPPGEDQAPAPTRARHRRAKGTSADGAQASASSAPSSSAVAPAADAPTWPPQPKTAPADAPTWPPQPKTAPADAPAWPPPQGTGAADGAKPPKQRRHLMQRIFGD